MSRRTPLLAWLGCLLLLTAACTNKKVNNPLANVGSKQPDKVLFDRAMSELKHNRFDQGRMILQTLINTYPDSEFIARAKLGVADSWYAEGGTSALAQAEVEYRDFETFFPNMPEAAEAQLKIANIHYQQMEKPDRDFTHAKRAEDEYRQLIQQYPDSKLVPEGKQRLLEVQEVLAEREFGVGRFYYIRESYPAAIARLRTVVERYPLFSKADEALYMLGQSYEGEVARVRATPKMDETFKAKVIREFTKNAAGAYSQILTRYPVMDRADDASKRLQALHQPVPQPTKEAIAQNQKEEDSRRNTGMFGRLLSNFSRHPDVAEATKVGEPTMFEPKPVSASDVVQAANQIFLAGSGASNNKVSVETVKDGTPLASEATPRSDSPVPAVNSSGSQPAARDNSTEPRPAPPAGDSAATPANDSAGAQAGSSNNAIQELKPNVADDSSGQTPPPPPQMNEIQSAPPNQPADTDAAGNSAPSADAKKGDSNAVGSSSSSTKQNDEQNMSSSSKKKKKKHHLF